MLRVVSDVLWGGSHPKTMAGGFGVAHSGTRTWELRLGERRLDPPCGAIAGSAHRPPVEQHEPVRESPSGGLRIEDTQLSERQGLAKGLEAPLRCRNGCGPSGVPELGLDMAQRGKWSDALCGAWY